MGKVRESFANPQEYQRQLSSLAGSSFTPALGLFMHSSPCLNTSVLITTSFDYIQVPALRV